MSTENVNWVGQAESIARFFGNGKEKQGNEGDWMTLCPVHGDSSTPNLHVSPTADRILLHCHACGDGRREEIVKKVREHFEISAKGISGAKVLKKDERGQWLTPVPSTAPPRPTDCYLNGILGKRTPDNVWAYLNENSEVLMFNARFNVIADDGSVGKTYRRLALYTNKADNSMAWSWFGPDNAMPLYGLEQLTDGWWKKPVMLVEGEKAADAARKLFPEMVVIAFPGGAGNFNRVNWDPLLRDKKIDKVLLWPDNDEAGRNMAHGPSSIAAFLNGKNVRTKVVPVFDEPGLPKKWDLADPLPDGWERENLFALLHKAAAADVADVARVKQYCATLKQMTIDGPAFEKASNTPCSSLAATDHSRCAQCHQFNRIVKPKDIVAMPDIQLKWVYLDRHKMFYNVHSHEELDAQGFNARWAASPGFTLTGQSAASATLLTDNTTTKAYDFGYLPGHPVILKKPNGEIRINQWSGFNINPDYSGQPEKWLELSTYLITDEKVREHIYDWLAFLVQRPDTKINHGILLISPVQGVGKDSLIQPLRNILGKNYRDISSQQLDSDFSEYLMRTKLLVISELDTIGHRNSTYDKMKPLLAAPPDTLPVNVKNMKQIEIDNVIQVIAFSNKDVPVAIEDSDRRWLVHKIEHHKKDLWPASKFQEYYAWIAKGGGSQVFGWLLKRDVSKFNPGLPAPSTISKDDVSRLSDTRLRQMHDLISVQANPFNTDLVLISYLFEAMQDKARVKIGLRDLAKYSEIYKGPERGTVLRPIKIKGRTLHLFVCRHADFWEKQSVEFLKKAFEDRYLDMARPGRSDSAESGDREFSF